ncbi:MAG: SseB family protein [Gammaproteobacteria bacterium]
MSETFEPRNDLERRLMAAQEGRLEAEEFMHGLLADQVFMPVREQDKIANFQRSDQAVPLSLEADDGTQVLVLFTSPERAKEFLEDFEGYDGGLLTEFSWVLERVGGGVGISLNPGWEVGMDLDPSMVQELAQLTAPAESNSSN